MNVIQENWEEIHAEAEKRAIRLGIPKERVLRLEALITPILKREAETWEKVAKEVRWENVEAYPTTAAHELMARWAFGIELMADTAETFDKKDINGKPVRKEKLWEQWEGVLTNWAERQSNASDLHIAWEAFKAVIIRTWQ